MSGDSEMLDYDILLKKKIIEKHHKSKIKIVELPAYREHDEEELNKKLEKKKHTFNKRELKVLKKVNAYLKKI